MSWIFSDRLNAVQFFTWFVKRVLFLFVVLTGLLSFSACGRVYFPIELQTISRSDRSEKQQDNSVVIVPMTVKNIKSANKDAYKRFIIEAGNLKKPAKLIPAEIALVERYPIVNDPGPYLIGVGDVIGYEEALGVQGTQASRVTRQLVVNEDGLINFFQLGRIKTEGITLSELEDLIFKKVVETGGNKNFNLFISKFRSKYISLYYKGKAAVIPYVSAPMYIEQILSNELLLSDETISVSDIDIKISIYRGADKYVLSYNRLLRDSQKRIRIFPGDRIFVEPLRYRDEKVLVVGETGAQTSIRISSSQRPSLSDTIFSGTVLNKTTSDFSQIYVIRKKETSFQAFHLDITNPTRVSLSNLFEMRPDDIVFVATQPLSLYSRTLSQILGSAGLTLQARDTIRTELKN